MILNYIVNLERLILEVFVVGYPDRGESQIILIREEEKIYFSCVIDCYVHNNVNKTIEILDELGIKSLNYFIWTHTDEDHSLGIIDLVRRFCDNNSNFVLPELTFADGSFVDYNSQIKSALTLIDSFNVGTRYCVNSCTTSPGGQFNILKNTFTDINSDKQVLFEIIGIAPCSALLRRRYNSGNISNKNDISIATLFKVGEINLMFSGDIEDQTINQIADYHFENVSYVKTPHHTSKTSTLFYKKLIKNKSTSINTSVTTINNRYNLPKIDILNEYKKISSKVFSTGLGVENFGYTITQFHIANRKHLGDSIFGNAQEL